MMDELDCEKALRVLYWFLDDELTSERKSTIEMHLDECTHCFGAFDFEAELRIVVRSRLTVEVPRSLIERVASAIQQERTHAL